MSEAILTTKAIHVKDVVIVVTIGAIVITKGAIVIKEGAMCATKGAIVIKISINFITAILFLWE